MVKTCKERHRASRQVGKEKSRSLVFVWGSEVFTEDGGLMCMSPQISKDESPGGYSLESGGLGIQMSRQWSDICM